MVLVKWVAWGLMSPNLGIPKSVMHLRLGCCHRRWHFHAAGHSWSVASLQGGFRGFCETSQAPTIVYRQNFHGALRAKQLLSVFPGDAPDYCWKDLYGWCRWSGDTIVLEWCHDLTSIRSTGKCVSVSLTIPKYWTTLGCCMALMSSHSRTCSKRLIGNMLSVRAIWWSTVGLNRVG